MRFEILLLVLGLLMLSISLILLSPLAWADAADEPLDVTEATISNVDDSDPDEPVPEPTVAPFDFVLLEDSSVKAVQRLDNMVDVLSGLLFFFGVSSGMIFFKILVDRIRTV